VVRELPIFLVFVAARLVLMALESPFGY
jgi:hypothetical protein